MPKEQNNLLICRNRAKKSSLTPVNLVFLLMKTTFDCVSRILLFSTWLYVANDGQFSSAKTVLAFYTTFLLLVVFNTVFNKTGEYCSAKTWTGKIIINPQAFKNKLHHFLLRDPAQLDELGSLLQCL